MNDRYFFCLDCKTFVPVGYRWAYMHLEQPRTVVSGCSVDVSSVLSAGQYWSTGDPKLLTVLHEVRSFLERHGDHRLQYGEFEFLFAHGQDWADWLSEETDQDEFLPRYFIEKEKCHTWDEMAGMIEALGDAPWWWTEPTSKAHVRDRFDELLKGAMRF